MNVKAETLLRKVEELTEFNPMLGHRGCRLAITYPEIYEMQVRAILEAACEVAAQGIDVRPEIMIPLAMTRRELDDHQGADRAHGQGGVRGGGPYRRVPLRHDDRAAARGDRGGRARGACGVLQLRHERPHADDARHLARRRRQASSAPTSRRHLREGSVPVHRRAGRRRPRRDGQGARSRKTRPNIKLGVCGEHGGDPTSIDFFGKVGLDYVSCSPFRVPIARLAAAQVALKLSGEKSTSSST
jgi:pyruvate,orthophosphate dikinase